MHVELRDRDNNIYELPTGLTLEVESYADAAMGGPADANITVSGPASVASQAHNWLGFGIRIYDDFGQLRWWGFVESAFASFLRKSLSRMFNRVKIIYSYDSPNGVITDETEWSENADFVARYGYREAVISANDTNEEGALAVQADALKLLDKKITEPELGDVGAYLECVGLWDKLDWRYYENLAGREVFESMDAEQPLGWEVTGTEDFGFWNGRIADREARFNGIPVGSMIATQYTGFNNRVHTVTTEAAVDEKVVVNYTKISFSADDDLRLMEEDESFLDLTQGEMITITGTALNNWDVFIKTLDDDYITTKPKPIQSEGSPDGIACTFSQGNSVKISEKVNREVPSSGNPISITALGTKAAQSFEIEHGDSWTLAEIWLNLKRVGTVTDDLKIELRADNSGVPGTLMESTTITGSDVPTAAWWMKFEFLNLSVLSSSTTYWLEISRTGAFAGDNFFVLGISEQLYPRGDMLLYTNVATWVSRSTDASVVFRILGKEKATDQAATMAAYAGFGYTGMADGDLELNQYRDGTLTVRDELLKLLARAESSGERWLPDITPEVRLRLTPMPASTETVGILGLDGKLRTLTGQLWPDGKLVAGAWIAFDGRLGHDPIFVERSEWDVASGQLRLEPGAGRFALGQPINR